MSAVQSLENLLGAIQILIDLPAKKLAENGILAQEVKAVIGGRNVSKLIAQIDKDYQDERNQAFNSKTPETQQLDFYRSGTGSHEFLTTYARYRSAAHDLYAKNKHVSVERYTEPVETSGFVAFNSQEPQEAIRSLRKDIENLPETKAFGEAWNSVFSDHALQINTPQDPTRLGSFIDYSPYIYNYQYYLAIPTLSTTVDRPIQIATREAPKIGFKDKELTELLMRTFKRERFTEKLQKLLLFSALSPRGSLIVPIQDKNREIRFNVFNDTQFTYSTGYQYARLDFWDDGGAGVTQISALGHLLKNGVTAHFLCPGFEPIFAIGKNRLFQLKEAAEAINIFLYTIKVLCIRSQVMIERWGGDSQTDTTIARLRKQSDYINSALSMSTAVKLPKGAELDIINNNITEGFAKIAEVVKDFQGMQTGMMSDYLYGSDTAYSANTFNVRATHQNIRSEIQEAQIEPVFRFCVNKYLTMDSRFAKWALLKDDYDIEFPSLYEPTESEKVELHSKKIDNIIKMAQYPELKEVFEAEDLISEEHSLPAPLP